MNKAQLWAQKLGKCPGVAAIFLSGSRAQGHGTDQSDIDFFIIAHPGQIWTARFFVFMTLKLNNQLAKPHHHQNTICPNHFITSDHLEIVEKDAYSANLFSHNRPLYDPDNLFPQFVTANQWVHNFGENFEHNPVGAALEPPAGKTRTGRDLSLPNNVLESILKHLQTWITKRNPEYKTPGAKIILTDTELRFHPNPKNKAWRK